MKYFLYGLTDDEIQVRRGLILETTKDQLVDVALKYVIDPKIQGKSSKVIFGSENHDLKTLESKGWRIEKFSEGLALRKKLFEDTSEEADSEWKTTI